MGFLFIYNLNKFTQVIKNYNMSKLKNAIQKNGKEQLKVSVVNFLIEKKCTLF